MYLSTLIIATSFSRNEYVVTLAYLLFYSFVRPVLNSYDFHRVRVEPYMTKISFLTAFFCASARPKNALHDSTWSKIQQILCCVHVRAEKKRAVCLNEI